MRSFFNWLFYGPKTEVDISLPNEVEVDGALIQLNITKLHGYRVWELNSSDISIASEYAFIRNENKLTILNRKSVGYRLTGSFSRIYPSFKGDVKFDKDKIRIVGSIGLSAFVWIISLLSVPFFIFCFMFILDHEVQFSLKWLSVLLPIQMIFSIIYLLLNSKEISKLRILLENLDPTTRPHSNS